MSRGVAVRADEPAPESSELTRPPQYAADLAGSGPIERDGALGGGLDRTRRQIQPSWLNETPKPLRKSGQRLNAALSLLPAVLFAGQGIVFPLAGLSVNLPVITALVLASLGVFLMSHLLMERFARPSAGIILASFGQLALGSIALLGYSYAAVALPGPFWDATLASLDSALGLDWPAYLAFITGGPIRQGIATLLYGLLILQLLGTGIACCVSARHADLQRFTLAWLIAGSATALAPALVPVLGAFHHFGITETMRHTLAVDIGYVQVDQISAIRAKLAFDPYAKLTGIVGFPSFHAAAGVLFAWLAWGFARLRWPLLIANLGMIAVTPVMGAHYFADIFAGIALALAAITLSHRIVRHGPLRRGSRSGDITGF